MKLNKKQKRTATIASMAALLAVVLGMGGQTFAKYITTTKVPTQTATVAKWGVVVKSDVNNLWGKTYGDAQTNGSLLAKAGTDSVVTTGESAVVAPGTTGYMTFSAQGTPEVKSQIKFDVIEDYQELELAYLVGGSLQATPYRPIEWTLEDAGSTSPITTVKGTLKDVVTAIEKLGEGVTNEANTSFTYSYKLTWNWAFDKDVASSVEDYRDTALANMIVGDENIDPNLDDTETYDKASSKTQIKFGLTITVEQVQ